MVPCGPHPPARHCAARSAHVHRARACPLHQRPGAAPGSGPAVPCGRHPPVLHHAARQDRAPHPRACPPHPPQGTSRRTSRRAGAAPARATGPPPPRGRGAALSPPLRAGWRRRQRARRPAMAAHHRTTPSPPCAGRQSCARTPVPGVRTGAPAAWRVTGHGHHPRVQSRPPWRGSW